MAKKKFNIFVISIFCVSFTLLPYAEAKKQGRRLTKEDLKKVEFSVGQVAPFFSKFRTVGEIVASLKKIASPTQLKTLKDKLSKLGLKNSDALPKVSVNGKWVKFEGVKGKYDFSRVHLGQISNGAKYLYFKSSKNIADNLEQWLTFGRTQKSKSALKLLLISEAYAGVGIDIAKMLVGAGLIVVSGLAYAALGVTAILGAIGSSTVAGAVAIGALLAAVTAVIYSIGEALVRSSLRRAHKVSCIKGRLMVTPKYGGGEPEMLEASWNYAESIRKGSVGHGEYMVRKFFCDNPESLEQVNAIFDEQGAQEGSADWSDIAP